VNARAGTRSITKVHGQRKASKMKAEEMILHYFGNSEPLIYIIASPRTKPPEHFYVCWENDVSGKENWQFLQ